MPRGKKDGRSYTRQPNVMWNKKMVLTLCEAWETKSPQEIADILSTKNVPVTAQNVTHMVQVLRNKGVYIPHKRKVGVYQVLVDEFLADHPEFVNAKKKK